jgi:hypothetical protein
MNLLETMRIKHQLGADISKTEILQMFGEISERLERLENLYADMAQDRGTPSKEPRTDVPATRVSRRRKADK